MPNDGAINGLLSGTDWAQARRVPLAGDASRRRYERLHLSSGSTAILMIAPPSSGEDVRPFVQIAAHLRDQGFSAPNVLAEDMESGLLLIEDLGDALFARLASEDPACETEIYSAAVDVLVRLRTAPKPQDLASMTPASLANDTELSSIWYAGAGQGSPEPLVLDTFRGLFETLAPLDAVLVLRDYHAENLIWLDDRRGISRVGLLDFQDALLGHPAYDLASLLWDARRDLAPGLADAMLSRYAKATGEDIDTLRLSAALFSAQRNLRILGIFARLSLASGKTGYLDFLPRVWGHLTTALQHPGLETLRSAILEHHPPPTPMHVDRLAAR